MKLFAFQRGAALGKTEHLPINHLNWRDVVHEAALLRALDLLISVDTLPAHLAGALGVPVWLLLHADPDWRWMRDREDSPWYPTMRLFRQTQQGVWQPVLERVAAELRTLSRARNQVKSLESRVSG
jgi:ADP-heptose:LPS heptosyltransferase